MNTRIITLLSLILAASFSRLIPHLPNFTAVGAIALFSGAYFTDKRTAYIAPLAALFLTDMILGFHSSMIFVYGSMALIVFLGQSFVKSQNMKSIGIQSFTSATLFFIITNFGHWIVSGMYEMNLQGLMKSYIAAIPFYGNTLGGQFFYTALLFGSFELAKRKFPVLTSY